MTKDKINILVVDDLPEKLLVFESILAELGENVIKARSGAEALQQVLRNEFAVILLDVNMPGMDGFETASLIRQRKKSAHVPIIFITAYADEMHTAQGYSLGAVDYILSPVVPEILCTKVRVFVDLFRMTEQVKKQAEERIALLKEQAARAAAEESNRRLAILARAGNILGRSLDYEATVCDVAGLAIPALADLSAVTFLNPGDGTWKTILAQVNHEGELILSESGNLDTLPGLLNDITRRVLATSLKQVCPLMESPSLDHDRAAAESTAVALPLQAIGRIIGVLALSMHDSGRVFSAGEVTLAEALASRAASALDNARLYSDVQRADRQKNEFLSMLAHELRNPLAPIRNAVHILKRKSSSGPELQWAYDVIDRQVIGLVRLVDDLLDVSRITSGKIRLKLEPVEVQAIVAQAVETSRPLIDARNHRLAVNLPTQPLWVRGDAVRLAQVLTNLLNNAAKYTDEGGEITLTVASEAGEVVMKVRDNGVGIPPVMMASIFELFTQVDRSLDRSQGGLGIGLTLVRQLVQMHCGSVHVFSAGANQGSEFTIRLPALAAHAQIPAGDKLEATAIQGGISNSSADAVRRRILVVDDNRDAAESLALLLRLEGYEVHTAYDGPTALQAASSFGPHLVLLDIGLPGMDGYEVARSLRRQPNLNGLILVALTGYSQKEDRQQSVNAGINHFVVKPIDLQVLSSMFTPSTNSQLISEPAAHDSAD